MSHRVSFIPSLHDSSRSCRKDINKEREEIIVFAKEFLDLLRRTQWDFAEAEAVGLSHAILLYFLNLFVCVCAYS